MYLLTTLLIVAALVTFVWAALGVYSGRINLIAAGLALLALVQLLQHVHT